MLETIKSVNWDIWIQTMSKGTPPLGLQLLALNVVFVIIVILRKMRRNPNNIRKVNHVVPVFVILANLVVLTQDQYTPLIQGRLYQTYHKMKSALPN